MALVALALAGCGGGDDGGDGTSTSAVESTAASIDESPTPAVLTQSSPVNSTTAATEQSATPGAATPTPAIVVSAPPVVIPTPRPAEATPVASGASAPPVISTASVSVGDGTGGPMTAVSAASGTPVAAATPVGAAETVASCDVADYPPYTGDQPVQMTTIDVNFRAGPGTDCPAIGEPIGAGVAVDVLSDPVRREGDDFVWVAVSLDGEQGWLATDFLEPASE
jgi:hypothetical protein